MLIELAVAAWLVCLVVVWLLCRAAARADAHDPHGSTDPVAAASPRAESPRSSIRGA